MDSFWNSVWKNKGIDSYIKYINLNQHFPFIDIFKKNGVGSICDIGCGFGKYSAICAYNGFDVYGLDISQDSVNISVDMLTKLRLPYKEFITCSTTDIAFSDQYFDGIVAHAVIDHLKCSDATKAVAEVTRILKIGGLAYFSFDGLDETDIYTQHEILDDGSFLYTDVNRQGMIFKYYDDAAIERLFEGNKIIYRNTKPNGERDIVLQKS